MQEELRNKNGITRRESLQRGLAAAGFLAAMSNWGPVASAQDEVDVPFTDIPAGFNPNNPNAPTRMLDIRKINGLITPKDQFFAIQHYNRPEVDGASYRLKLSGLVNKPAELSLADIRGMKSVDLVAGYECSGNSPRSMQGLSSCGKFTGVRLSDVLKRAGVGSAAREVVFFGTDRGEQEVVFRQNTWKLDQQFARSITLENAMKPEPILAYALNGEPLAREQGFPLRVIMPGWYGVANVKWLSEIHLQEDRFVGNYQARWYRSVRGEDNGGPMQWVENEISKLHLKSVIARVTKKGNAHQVLGWILNDGTPLKTVEVQIDGGAWQKATFDPANTQYSWKLFTYKWEGATPGEHTLVSRVTDSLGRVQPGAPELANKKTFLEDNAMFPRKVMIS
jgi:DMSO/TMAO reductase YedYZ molybdopterin-dependent catalytic subunit